MWASRNGRGEGGMREEGARRGQGGKGARRESEEGGRGGREGRGGVTPMQDKGPEPGLGASDLCVFSCRMVFPAVWFFLRSGFPAVWLLCRESAVTYFVSLSRRFLRDASSTISPSTSSPSAMMKAAGMAGMLYRPMYGDAFPRASQTFVQGSS